jgi:2-methylcitrate dehydratase PrpD
MHQETKTSSSALPDFARTFSEFSCGLDIRSLPSVVIDAAKTNLFDTLACAMAGRTAPGVEAMLSLVKDWGGKAEASIFCTDLRLPAHHAAWLNGIMAHARDYDDTHDGAVLHAGISVVPAALAAAELAGDASGADILAGIVVGLELMCRLGVATKIGIIDSGFIYSALFGYFAATAAAARVLRLDPDQTTNALGIAYSQAAGTHQVTRDAALTKRMQPGFAAKAALISVQMTQRGIRGAQNTFEGADGLFRTYLRGEYDADLLRAGLGEHYEFTNLSYKPYPCCRFDHTAIDAALAIKAQSGFRVDGIRSIVASTNNQAYEAVCTPVDIRKAPKTIVQAQFSIPYTVACALVDGGVALGHFTQAGIGGEAILAVAAQVECRVDAAIERDWGRNISPTHLVVETDDGRFEARVDYPRGHPRAAMLRADFDAKLRDCLTLGGSTGADAVAGRLRNTIDTLEHAKQGNELITLVTLGAI